MTKCNVPEEACHVIPIYIYTRVMTESILYNDTTLSSLGQGGDKRFQRRFGILIFPNSKDREKLRY